MKKFLILCVSLLAGFGQMSQAQDKYVTEIPVEAGERWWGADKEGRSWAEAMEDAGADYGRREFVTNMLVSNTGRYVWSRNPVRVSLDGQKITAESDYERIEVQKGGKTLREAYLVCVHRNIPTDRKAPAAEFFTRPVYRPQNSQITWGQDEILEYARKIVSEGLPVGTIVIPEGWCSANVLFTFQPELFPDPKRMIEQLHGMGFKVMLTVTPSTPTIGRVASKAAREGYSFMRRGDGYTVLNFRDERFFRSFREGFEKLTEEYAFDGYRLEHRLPQTRTLWLAFDDPFRLNWEKLTEGVTDMCEMDGAYPCAFPRYVSEMYPYSLDHPENELRNLFASSLSGDMYKTIGYFDHHQDGRNNAAHAITSLFFPVASVNFVPWEFKERKLYDQFREAVLFRASIADYMQNLHGESAKTGEPIVRNMEYQFPRNGFSDCDDQFMLGPKYLIAPILTDAPTRMVRLPKGRWTDKRGVRHKGPVVLQVDAGDGLVYFESTK